MRCQAGIGETDLGEVTVLLQQVGEGRADARASLFALLYRELGQLARSRLARESTLTALDTHALLHETFIRMVNAGSVQAADRAAFYGYAASVMRSVIVDHARQRQAGKRGAGQGAVTLITEFDALPADEAAIDVEALESALERLREVDERCCRIVELRYYAGLAIEDVAEALALSPATVKRDWQKARAFLFHQLRER